MICTRRTFSNDPRVPCLGYISELFLVAFTPKPWTRKNEAGELIPQSAIADDKLETLTAKTHENVDDIPNRDILIDTIDLICLVHPTFLETLKPILGPKYSKAKIAKIPRETSKSESA